MIRTLHYSVVPLLVLCICCAVRAESASVLLEKGIFAEETKGDLDEAINIYNQIVGDAEAGRIHVAEALYRLGNCHLRKKQQARAVEAFRQLVSQFPDQKELTRRAKEVLDRLLTLDPASLMPPDTVLYVEIGSPGRQAEKILNMLKGTPLENPLAVLGGQRQPTTAPGAAARREKTPADIISALLNPSMIKEFKKIRGLAFGLTDIARGQQRFIAVFQPGESDALRGILTAALLTLGQPAEPIEGMQTVFFGSEAACALDNNVILITSPPERLNWCVRQYKGTSKEPTLASTNKTFASFASRERRKEDALTVWADPGRIFAGIEKLTRGSRSVNLEAIDGIFDFKNMEGAVARLVLDEKNPHIEARVGFKDGHRCLAYDLIRTPRLGRSGFEAVPPEAIALASVALLEGDGQEASSAEARSQAIEHIVGLDIGREIFNNIEQITLFLMPPGPDALEHPLGRKINPAIPSLGLVIASRDPIRTRQVIDRLLTIVDLIVGKQTTRPTETQPQRRYCIGKTRGEEIYCYVDQVGSSTIIALDSKVLDASLAAVKAGRSALTAGPFQKTLSDAQAYNKLIVINAGGATKLAKSMIRKSPLAQELLSTSTTQPATSALDQLAEVLSQTNVVLRTTEQPNLLDVHLGITGLPPLAEVIPPLMQFQQQEGAAKKRLRQLRKGMKVSIDPIFLDDDTFEAATSKIQITNETNIPVKFQGTFRTNPHLTVQPSRLELDVPPKSVKTVDLSVLAKQPAAISSLSPLMLNWKLIPEPSGHKALKSAVQQLVIQKLFHCARRTSPVAVDGKLDEWDDLPFQVSSPAQAVPPDGSVRFAVAEDEKYLYVAVEAIDDDMYVNPKRLLWQKDCLAVRLIAVPEPRRSRVRWYWDTDWKDVLPIIIAPPTAPGEKRIHQASKLPEGTLIACVKTTAGYNAEIAIPASYLNYRQGGPWQAFRLNVALYDCDSKGKQVRSWWQPGWPNKAGFAGNGTFRRKEEQEAGD